MGKTKFVPTLLILLIFGIQAFISCATGIGEEEEPVNNSVKSSSSARSGSSSSGQGNSSSSYSSVTGASSSSIFVPPKPPEPPEPEYGEDYTDNRNSEIYKTVKIGNQTWMERNLNYKPDSPTGLTKCYAEGYGYDDWLKPDTEAAKIEDNCNKYGRLYDWTTAMNLPNNCATSSCGSQVQEKHQGLCPSGWHIPSQDEWKELKDYVFDIIWNNFEDEDFGWGVGTKLKAASGWKPYNGIENLDTYGFNAIGSGYCYSCDKEGLNNASGSYSSIDEITHWWSATEYVNPYTKEAVNAYRFTLSYTSNEFIEKSFDKSDLYSVRCIKD